MRVRRFQWRWDGDGRLGGREMSQHSAEAVLTRGSCVSQGRCDGLLCVHANRSIESEAEGEEGGGGGGNGTEWGDDEG